jgi:hypothetical protein
MRVFVQSKQPWTSATVTGIYIVIGVLTGMLYQRFECSEHYQTKVSNLNRIINCNRTVIQKKIKPSSIDRLNINDKPTDLIMRITFIGQIHPK